MNYDKIKNEIKNFVEERDWEQFHSPKNLSMALSVEASELVEIFQWQTQDEYQKNEEKVVNVVKDEVADIFYYVVRMCQKMNIDLENALFEKMKKNKQKYPADKVKGKLALG